MRSQLLNGGAYCRTAFAAINRTATAGGTGDNTEVDCAYVDRIKDSDAAGGIAQSMKLVIGFTSALNAGETLSFAIQIQDDADGVGSGTDFGEPIVKTVVATGASPNSTEVGTVEVDVDLSGAKRFVRAQVTPDLSRGGTDTAEWAASYVMFGHDPVPISQAIANVSE